jgi:SRSO17 transposase
MCFEKSYCNKANNNKEKAKTGWFRMDSVLELTTKNLRNSLNFLTITHTTLSAKQFRSYGILMIDVATEFCFWTEQRLNGS